MLYLKALHIIFIVTWFSGMFYIVRLFIYATEANEQEEPARGILLKQYNLMSKRLWYGITFPSALLTLVFGPLVLYFSPYWELFKDAKWLHVKLTFVILLYVYFYTLHKIFSQQQKGIFKYSSKQLRIWNEVATIFLVAIVILAVVKNAVSWVYGLIGLILFVVILMMSIQLYKKIRESNKDS